MSISASGDNRNGYVVLRVPFSDGSGDTSLVGLYSTRVRAEARAWREASVNYEPVDRLVVIAAPLDTDIHPIPSDNPDADIRLLETQEGNE